MGTQYGKGLKCIPSWGAKRRVIMVKLDMKNFIPYTATPGYGGEKQQEGHLGKKIIFRNPTKVKSRIS